MADGLCNSHYRQKYRGNVLTPLRPRAGRERMSGIRISAEALSELEAEAQRRDLPPATIASEVIERWAKRQGGGKEAGP